MSTRIVIVVNAKKVRKYRRILNRKYAGVTVDIVALTGDEMLDCFQEKDVALFLICVENCSDLLRYFTISKRVDRSKHLFWMSNKAKMVNGIIRARKGKIISYAGNKGVRMIRELINTVTDTRMFNLSCDDVLEVCTNGTILCRCHRGTIEEVLERIKVEIDRYEGRECCLVDIVGDITLQEMLDVGSLLPLSEDMRMSYGSGDAEKVKVFLLWRKMCKR